MCIALARIVCLAGRAHTNLNMILFDIIYEFKMISMNVLMNTINELSWKLFNNDFCDLDESKQEVVMTEFIINYN